MGNNLMKRGHRARTLRLVASFLGFGALENAEIRRRKDLRAIKIFYARSGEFARD